MTDYLDHQCLHIVSANDHAKRQCGNMRTVGDYCGLHATHPQRRIEQSKISLHDFVEDAMRALGEIVTDGEKDADRVRAANSILDRTGYIPGQAITLTAANAQLDERLRELLNDRTDDDSA